MEPRLVLERISQGESRLKIEKEGDSTHNNALYRSMYGHEMKALHLGDASMQLAHSLDEAEFSSLRPKVTGDTGQSKISM